MGIAQAAGKTALLREPPRAPAGAEARSEYWRRSRHRQLRLLATARPANVAANSITTGSACTSTAEIGAPWPASTCRGDARLLFYENVGNLVLVPRSTTRQDVNVVALSGLEGEDEAAQVYARLFPQGDRCGAV
jgi:Ni2+-binding GTPase involved in maturation of urease and hydrogenase